MNDNLQALRGRWEMISAVRDGQPLGAEFVATGRYELLNDVTTVRFRGQVFMQGTTRADASATPGTVDYVLTHSPGRGKKQLGIWEHDGETLRICVALPGRPRPLDFATRLGDDLTLMVWRPA